MFHRWPALVLVLVVSAMMPKQAAGQEVQSPQKPPSAGKFGKSWPNPFNPVVNTAFTVGSGSCSPGETHAVSVRILNILAQPVVVPIIRGPSANSTSSASSSLNGARISNLRLECGDYVAFWDGKLEHGGDAASGTYIVQLLVDGKLSASTRIFY